MKKFASLLLIGASFAISANSALAADIIEPPVVIEPEPVVIESSGGWYIRGDVDYHMADMDGVTYAVGGGTDEFTSASLDDSWSLGGGIGYNVSKHFRVDLTADYWAKSNFRGSTDGACGAAVTCVSTDTSAMSAWVLLANAYADLGTYAGFTPYVGAGIGVAHVNWDRPVKHFLRCDKPGQLRCNGCARRRQGLARCRCAHGRRFLLYHRQGRT